jgi:hypothetical protein
MAAALDALVPLAEQTARRKILASGVVSPCPTAIRTRAPTVWGFRQGQGCHIKARHNRQAGSASLRCRRHCRTEPPYSGGTSLKA